MQALARLEAQLVCVHREPVEPAVPPQAPPPEPAIRRQAKKEALSEISLFAFSARREARRRAREQAEVAITDALAASSWPTSTISRWYWSRLPACSASTSTPGQAFRPAPSGRS